jgi:hypothetical protein
MAIVVVCALAAATVATAAPSASAAPRWAAASKATIHPGVRTFTSGTQCRAGFVFYDARAVYLSQPPWCSDALPLGTRVKIEGAKRPGTLVYNSWLTMERVGKTISGNDFALVRIDKADRRKVNPSVPFWGGPVAGGGRSSLGKRVYTYGNSEVYRHGTPDCWWPEDDCRSAAGVNTLSPRIGINTTTQSPEMGCPLDVVPPPGFSLCGLRAGNGVWWHNIYTVAPGISGDQGSAVLDERGRAFGILAGPWHDTTDHVTDLPKAMAYMKANTSLDAIRLAKGTEPFLPPL